MLHSVCSSPLHLRPYHVQVLKVKVHGQEAALKLLGAQNRSMSAKDKADAERELAVMQSLRHPCIVQVNSLNYQRIEDADCIQLASTPAAQAIKCRDAGQLSTPRRAAYRTWQAVASETSRLAGRTNAA